APHACHLADAVAVESGAVDQKPGLEFPRRGRDDPAVRSLAQGKRFCSGDHLAVNPGDQNFADFRIVHDSFLRNAERGDASYVRLDLAHGRGAEHLEAIESILASALMQI